MKEIAQFWACLGGNTATQSHKVIFTYVTDEVGAGGEGVESGELFSLARVGGRIFRGLGEERLMLGLSLTLLFESGRT